MHDEESILGWVFAAIATVVSTLAAVLFGGVAVETFLMKAKAAKEKAND